MAFVGRCPLDKRVGCEAVPTDWGLVGREGGVGARQLNVPYVRAEAEVGAGVVVGGC